MTPFIDSTDFAAQGGEDYGYIAADSQAWQTGDVLARIATGADAGKYGPFSLAATDGRQTLANVVGVAAHRVSAVDASGIQERVLPNQEGRIFTFINRCSATKGNAVYYYDAGGVRQGINSEAGLTTKNYLAAHGFFFKN